MQPTEMRVRLRSQLTSATCIQPASVYDPLSARMADSLGFEFAVLAGSVASAVALGAPDMTLMTLTELAEQARRIMRAADVSLTVDADHGYGNALNVMRTVRELEDAGVSALTIEDTVLPAQFGAGSEEQLISVDELQGKLRAALEARRDPQTVIVGRTHALRSGDMEEALARARAMEACGVDALFFVGVNDQAQLRALAAGVRLPVVLGATPQSLPDGLLAQHGVRLVFRGHAPFQAMVEAVYEALANQAGGKPASEMAGRLADAARIALATGSDEYARWREAFLS